MNFMSQNGASTNQISRRLRELEAEVPPAAERKHHEVPLRSKARQRLGSSARGQVIPDLSMWNQAARIGGGITPSRISSIIRSADTGDVRALIDLSNECRQRDAHLQAVLGTHEESIAALPYQIVAPIPHGSEKAKAKDERAARWVEAQLRANPNIQRLIADLAGSFYYSFSVVEIVWRREGGKLIPDAFLPVAQRRFRFRREDGKLVHCDDGATEIDFREEYPNKFILSQPRVTGDIPSREGLCRVLIWMSMMRNWDIADWLRTGEMSWKPYRVATYTKATASGQDVDDVKEVMRRMTTDFTAVIPDSTKIDITWPGGSNSGRSTHAELCNVLAQEMSKAVLGQTETTQASASSGYAQAKVHDNVRRDLREARARQIAADITRDLIGPMIRLNFGDGVEIPRFEFVTQDPIDLKSFAEAVGKLVVAGAQIPSAWVNEQAGIPEPKKGEAVLKPPTPAATETDDDEAEEEAPKKPAGKKPAGEEEPEAAEDGK